MNLGPNLGTTQDVAKSDFGSNQGVSDFLLRRGTADEASNGALSPLH